MITRVAFPLAVMALFSCVSLAGRAFAQDAPALIREDFSSDPRWEGSNNRLKATFPPRVLQRFGYSPTNHAGRAGGEIGGHVQSSTRPAWYAAVIKPLTLDDAISFSGSFVLLEGRSIMGYHTLAEINIGFFNHAEQGWRPKDFLGFRLMGTNEPDGAIIEVVYGTSTGAAAGGWLRKTGVHTGMVKTMKAAEMVRIAPGCERHRWTLRYDPKARDGAGEIAFALDGGKWTVPVLPEHRKAGAAFDRFGIFNQQIPGRAMVAFFDDLNINGRPEDFARDPGWESHGNDEYFEDGVLYGTNDFGFSVTSFCGGKPGEIGGRLWRVNEPEYKAWYGTDVGTLTLSDRLEARGRICIRRFSIDTGMHIGFFNAGEQGWRPVNFVGVNLDSYTPGGRYFMPMYGTASHRKLADVTVSPWFVDDGRTLDFAVSYDPGAAGGRGAVTAKLGGQTAVLPLEDGAKTDGAVMNRFGLFNMQDNNGKHCEVYLDDLVYTTRKARRP